MFHPLAAHVCSQHIPRLGALTRRGGQVLRRETDRLTIKSDDLNMVKHSFYSWHTCLYDKIIFLPDQIQNTTRNINAVISICWLLFALFLVHYLTLLTGKRKASEEGEELFKVQQVISVMIQVFQYLLCKFGVLLRLEDHQQGIGLECNCSINAKKITVATTSDWNMVDISECSYFDKGWKLLIQKFLQLRLVQVLPISVFRSVLLKSYHHHLQGFFHISHDCGCRCW